MNNLSVAVQRSWSSGNSSNARLASFASVAVQRSWSSGNDRIVPKLAAVSVAVQRSWSSGNDRTFWGDNAIIVTAHQREKWFFDVIGEVFAEYLHVASSARPRIMRALFHSLWWFRQACVEHSPLMAAIKHAAAIEALADGREKQGIVELLSARLSLDRKRQAFKDGTTLDQFIGQLYGVARSQTLHGTNVRHAEDWSQLQARSEQMARLALRSVTYWLSRHPGIDDPAALRRAADPAG